MFTQENGTQDLIGTDTDYIYKQCPIVKSVYNKNSGNQFHQLFVSLRYKNTWEHNDALKFLNQLLSYLPDGHQILYAIHEDQVYLHIHYIINSIKWYTSNRLNVNLDTISWFSQSTDNLEQFMNQRYNMRLSKHERLKNGREELEIKKCLRL